MRSRFWLNTWSRASVVEKTPTSSRFSSSTRTWDDLCSEGMLDTSVCFSTGVLHRSRPRPHTTITPQMEAHLMASLMVYILPKRLRRSCLASIASHCSCSRVTGSRRRSSFRAACARVANNRNTRGGVLVCVGRRHFIASDTTQHACNGCHACSRIRTARTGGPVTNGRGRAPPGTLSIAGLVIQRCFSIAAASISKIGLDNTVWRVPKAFCEAQCVAVQHLRDHIPRIGTRFSSQVRQGAGRAQPRASMAIPTHPALTKTQAGSRGAHQLSTLASYAGWSDVKE